MHRTRSFPLGVLLAALTLTLPACEAQPEEDAADMAGEMPEPATTPPAGGDTGAVGDEMMASFQSLNQSGITGEIRIEPADNQTRIIARVMGVPTQGTLQGHIHTGTCDAPGSRVTPLEAITTAANGSGESTSVVDLPIATVANGEHIVMFHEVDGAPGQPVACAAIPQR